MPYRSEADWTEDQDEVDETRMEDIKDLDEKALVAETRRCLETAQSNIQPIQQALKVLGMYDPATELGAAVLLVDRARRGAHEMHNRWMRDGLQLAQQGTANMLGAALAMGDVATKTREQTLKDLTPVDVLHWLMDLPSDLARQHTFSQMFKRICPNCGRKLDIHGEECHCE